MKNILIAVFPWRKIMCLHAHGKSLGKHLETIRKVNVAVIINQRISLYFLTKCCYDKANAELLSSLSYLHLVEVMACRTFGIKPSSEIMLAVYQWNISLKIANYLYIKAQLFWFKEMHARVLSTNCRSLWLGLKMINVGNNKIQLIYPCL